MIYINLNDITLPQDWLDKADELTEILVNLPSSDRIDFINSSRHLNWGDRRLLEALSRVAGNKCWYSEVPLEGQDPNIDHFRPKGRVIEVTIDPPFEKTGKIMENGYWWLAFQWKNFRLSSMHANQRRVDENTSGGKADYFPVRGKRAGEKTFIDAIDEDILPLDPCVLSDMELIWFDPDGKPGFKNWKRVPTDEEVKRLKLSTWLYHLDKSKIVKARSEQVADIRKDIITANTFYLLWNPNGPNTNLIFKTHFNNTLSTIRTKISNYAPYAGAKRCAVRTHAARYSWIFDFGLLQI